MTGRILVDYLDTCIEADYMTANQANFVAGIYDNEVVYIFDNRLVTANMNCNSNRVFSYNFVDNVWKFFSKEINATVDNKRYILYNSKIVACNADAGSEVSRKRKTVPRQDSDFGISSKKTRVSKRQDDKYKSQTRSLKGSTEADEDYKALNNSTETSPQPDDELLNQ